MPQPTPPIQSTTGLIDIHSHLLPGVDDGCRDDREVLECVRRLQVAGFVGSICTPHVWPTQYPDNRPDSIARHVERVRKLLLSEGIDHALWPGGEVRLEPNIVPFLEANGVPTLGPSRHVLADIWDPSWPRHADRTIQWLMDRGYTVILAHPERLNLDPAAMAKLAVRLRQKGVLLQGNVGSIVGQNGFAACQAFRAMLAEDAFTALALDMHRPDSLDDRLSGIGLVELDYGPEVVQRLMSRAPQRLLLGTRGDGTDGDQPRESNSRLSS